MKQVLGVQKYLYKTMAKNIAKQSYLRHLRADQHSGKKTCNTHIGVLVQFDHGF